MKVQMVHGIQVVRPCGFAQKSNKCSKVNNQIFTDMVAALCG
jgi:hypothetical protein